MPGTTVSSGPYTGGLNTLSDAGAIADDELVICRNFEVDPDGSLKTRPPLVSRGVTLSLGTTGDMRLLGYYIQPADGTQRIIASNGTGTYYFTGTAWTLITSTIAAAAVVQFNAVLYLLAPAGASNPSGYWNGTAFTADSAMPKGSAIVAYKSRLWVATDANTVQYSAVIPDSNFWTIGGTYGGSLKINAGDGQSNVALLVAFGNLLIFRTKSIWQFSFSTDPAYGAQQSLVTDVGLASSDALSIFENIAYFIYDGKAYVLNGANATQLNSNVPFVATNRTGIYLPYAVSIVNRRVVFTYYDTLYVFNLRSRTWTTWTSTAYPGIGKFLQYTGANSSDLPVYITHPNVSVPSGGSRVAQTLFFTDGTTNEAESAPFMALLQTKIFDYATPGQYKRLFWWGADVAFKSPLTATVIPVVYATQVTWGQALSTTWGQALNNTWGQPSLGSFDATTTVNPVQSGTAPYRKFARFAKSLRFRRVYYTISFMVDGAIATSPAKVFGLDTIVSTKQVVSRQIS